MKPATLRLPEGLWEELDSEAEERGFSSRAAYIRWILRNRPDTGPESQSVSNRYQTSYDDGVGPVSDRDRSDPDTDTNPVSDRHRSSRPDGGAVSDRHRTDIEDLEERIGSLEDTIEQLVDVDADDQEADDEQGEKADETIEEVLSGWRPGRTPAERRERREAGKAALRWLRSQDGWRSGGEFRSELLPEFSVSDQNEDTWWRKTARPALKAGIEAGIIEFRDGHHDYRWVQGEE